MPQIVANLAACFVFRRLPGGEVEFLLLRRAAHLSFPDTWQPVYGRIKPGETAWQAAVRELREETGLSPLRFWQTPDPVSFYHARTDELTLCPCFAAEVASDAVVRLNAEHVERSWLAEEAALRVLLWPAQRRIMRQVVEEIITPGRAEPFLRIDGAV